MRRVVVAGLGDTGVLCAVGLRRALGADVEVVGVTTKPEWISGQELGTRLARPEAWQRDYRIGFERFRGLDGVRVVHGALTGAELDGPARQVTVQGADGVGSTLAFDALVVATGVGNGFWRRPAVQDAAAVDAGLADAHRRLAAAGSIAVVGGGAAAVSTAVNAATVWPGTDVDLYFPGERGLPQHHRAVWDHVARRLTRLGVRVHPGHRAVLPADPDRLAALDTGPLSFSTGQPEAGADVVVWAVGRVTPHTGWLPASALDADGFVRVDRHLQVPGHDAVLAVGDVAATDPLRTSARNNGHRVLVRNVVAHLDGGRLAAYRPPRRRWGSVLGAQPDGLEIFAPNGRPFRIPPRVVDTVLQPLVVRRGIYGGVRPSR